MFKTALSQNVERLQLRTIITIASGYGYGLWVKIGTQKWKVDIKFIKKHKSAKYIAVAVGGKRHSYVYPDFDSQPTCVGVEAEIDIKIPYKVGRIDTTDKIAL